MTSCPNNPPASPYPPHRPTTKLNQPKPAQKYTVRCEFRPSYLVDWLGGTNRGRDFEQLGSSKNGKGFEF
jgi:hypothetical protein